MVKGPVHEAEAFPRRGSRQRNARAGRNIRVRRHHALRSADDACQKQRVLPRFGLCARVLERDGHVLIRHDEFQAPGRSVKGRPVDRLDGRRHFPAREDIVFNIRRRDLRGRPGLMRVFLSVVQVDKGQRAHLARHGRRRRVVTARDRNLCFDRSRLRRHFHFDRKIRQRAFDELEAVAERPGVKSDVFFGRVGELDHGSRRILAGLILSVLLVDPGQHILLSRRLRSIPVDGFRREIVRRHPHGHFEILYGILCDFYIRRENPAVEDAAFGRFLSFKLQLGACCRRGLIGRCAVLHRRRVLLRRFLPAGHGEGFSRKRRRIRGFVYGAPAICILQRDLRQHVGAAVPVAADSIALSCAQRTCARFQIVENERL